LWAVLSGLLGLSHTDPVRAFGAKPPPLSRLKRTLPIPIPAALIF
jgi:hypothetical protein